ncbi:uncharacterized protein BJ212DRAFT_1480968 [Suillus subaureus]|uniref:Uncharacterized protein n=1 Tax=Suillus subaureus TaxID=48587 RepID=A0A9P7EB59_9AGAM|nr:uncharacterized protein BJ212DRAFT_1480968 [Suillus subaureus]KAG1816539.1 hypothetical protein BJ212DRAFT_1480968 [Suillus subaureus]
MSYTAGASSQVERRLGGMPVVHAFTLVAHRKAVDFKKRVQTRNGEWNISELLKMAWKKGYPKILKKRDLQTTRCGVQIAFSSSPFDFASHAWWFSILTPSSVQQTTFSDITPVIREVTVHAIVMLSAKVYPSRTSGPSLRYQAQVPVPVFGMDHNDHVVHDSRAGVKALMETAGGYAKIRSSFTYRSPRTLTVHSTDPTREKE